MNTKNHRKPHYNIGYTTKDHLCIDFDDASFYHVCKLCELLIHEYPYIGSVLILQSSKRKLSEKWIYPVLRSPKKYINKDSYHAIFNTIIDYEESCRIIETLALLDVLDEAYVRIREMRNDMTIRISETVNTLYVKPKPIIVHYIHNKHDKEMFGGIYRFLRLYKLC